MISKRTLAAIAIILIPIGVLAALLQAAEDPPTELYVRTTPAGATLTLDGKDLGTAPGVFEVAPGKHELLAVLDGYKSAKREIVVPATRIKRVILPLRRIASSAEAVRATPSDEAGEEIAKTIFLPDAATPDVDVALDLATGELLAVGDGSELARLGKGDLLYDAKGGSMVCLRGGRAAVENAGRFHMFQPTYGLADGNAYGLHPMPYRMLIKTAEGKDFDVTILSRDTSKEGDEGIPGNVRGVRLKYERAAPDIMLGPFSLEVIPNAQPPSRLSFLPDNEETPDVGRVLDLASGEMFKIDAEDGFADVREFTRRRNKGDLYYGQDEEDGGSFIGCMRGATAAILDDRSARPLEPSQKREDVTVYRLPPLPCHLLVTTAEHTVFDVRLIRVRTSQASDMGIPRNVSGIALRHSKQRSYDRVRVEASAAAKPVSEAVSQQGAKTIFLPDAETRGVAGVLDLASGEMLPISGDKGFDAMRQFTRQHNKGDLYYGYDEDEKEGPYLGCVRGATAVIWDGKRARAFKQSQKREEVTVYLLPPLPCRLLIKTAEQKAFDVTLLSAGKSGENDKGAPRNVSGARLKYKRVALEVPPTAGAMIEGATTPEVTGVVPDDGSRKDNEASR